MKIYHVHRTQFIPITITEAWEFFSSPKNLIKITPTDIDFKILYVSGGDKCYAGQIIRYHITILPLVKVQWVTEITQVKEPFYFIDDQRSGPFSMWHHQHSFKEVAGGVEMTDELTYAVPLGILGRLAHAVFVGRQVKHIFDYRNKVLEKIFSAAKP